ncbi:hypothetical protein Pan161_47350 [Gimesia algae]|uniref:Uncharacterized protein n=1 Tax=Gimesia algae TaxID=2527971 RepID=A0A517VJ84_9PLAN|nr:hypothetical protein Pan161_47350 [Gimesia algae]
MLKKKDQKGVIDIHHRSPQMSLVFFPSSQKTAANAVRLIFEKESDSPNAIRGCRRQQETARAGIQLSFRSPTCPPVVAVPTCPPTWRCANWFRPSMDTDETSKVEFSTSNNTKRHERSKWVIPNAIRAERSEQEVTAATYHSEPHSPHPFGTVGQAVQTRHRGTFQ